MAEQIRVVVAGVPRSYQQPFPDGRWLTDEHVAQIAAVSPRIDLIHTSRTALAAGDIPAPAPEVLLIEASGDEPYRDEIPLESFAQLVTPRLRWVQTCSSGVGHVLSLGLLPDDVTITNAAGVHADALGESVMAAVLLHAKRIPERIERQARHEWVELRCTELRGKTICIIGMGNIGSAVARLASAFRMHVVGVRRSLVPTEYVDEVVAPSDLHRALAVADYIVIACPLTPETEGMLGPAEFAATRRGAYLINISRGKVVQEPAMLAALADGTLSGAFLDAHAQEPLPPEHPLWTTPHVIVMPHDSHSSPYLGDNIVALFADNLRRYTDGEPLRNVVDRERGY